MSWCRKKSGYNVILWFSSIFVWEDHSLANGHQNQMTGNHPWDRLDPSWLDRAPWFDGCVCLFHSSDPTNLAYHIEPLCWHSNSTWHPLILYKIDVHSDNLIHKTAYCICYKYMYTYCILYAHALCVSIYIYNIYTLVEFGSQTTQKLWLTTSGGDMWALRRASLTKVTPRIWWFVRIASLGA